MNSHAPLFSKEIIKNIIAQFPSTYEEMHEKKSLWHDSKEKLSQIDTIISYLKQNSDSEHLQLLADLAHNVGVFYIHVTVNYPKSMDFLTLAIESKNKIPDIDEQSLALSYAQLADCAYRNGNYALAINQFNLAHDLYKKKAGDKHADLMRAFILHACGNAFCNMGGYRKAINLFSEAKQIRKHHLPEDKDNIEFGYLKQDWADALTELEDFDQAQKYYASSLSKKKKNFQTEEHTNIALLYQCQALMHIKTKQFEKAEHNLKMAQSIYEKHNHEFNSEYQVDLFRNYFYSINLQLAKGDWKAAEKEINLFISKLNAIYKNNEHPYLYRMAHEQAEFYHHQNQPELAINALKESLTKFLPDLEFSSASKLPDDKKIEIAQLISRYHIELFLHNQCQGFNECLSIISLGLQLKQDFYENIQQLTRDKNLGSLDFAFSFYDLGLLYYFDGFINGVQKQFENALVHFNKAKEYYLTAGLKETHKNILMCEEKINETKIATTQKTNSQVLTKFSIFVHNPNQEYSHNAVVIVPYPNTIIRNYP